MKPAALFAAALILALPDAPAAACSPVPGYRVPSTPELVERAEVIILGIVEREEVGEPVGEVVIRPTQLLKGTILPAEVRLTGYFSRPDWRATPSNPRELFEPNPDALSGGCQRYTFDPGMTLLLFLERDGAQLRPIRDPFSRAAEDVPSPDAPG